MSSLPGGPRRIEIPRTGGPEVLEVRPFSPGDPGPGEVAIDVAAIGVNFADLFCRLGLYAAAPPRPFAPGFEVAGVVAAVGPPGPAVAPPDPAAESGRPPLRVGDRVIAVTRFGGYATRINVRATWVRALPAGWSFAQGAAFPVAFLTAWYGLCHLGRVDAGEVVLVHSAAGGVGTAACRLASRAGAKVIGTVGSEAKAEVARAHGAHEVVVTPAYDAWDAIDAAARRVAQRGVERGGRAPRESLDVVFDAVGGRALANGFSRLRPGGRLIAYGFAGMMPARGVLSWPRLAWRYLRRPRLDPFAMTGTNRSVIGFNLVYLWDRAELLSRAFDSLLARAASGEITPLVGATFPFERTADAHRLMQSRGSTGKIVLLVE